MKKQLEQYFGCKVKIAEYKNKLVSLLDEDTKKYEFKE